MVITSGLPALTTFYVYLTSACNCACRHCWIVPAVVRENVWLAPATLRRAIEQAMPLGLQRLKWTGGEPTLHPDFVRLLDVQAEFGLCASLETNGMLVDARLAEKLRESGVATVSVSLDGATPAIHDAIRGVDGGCKRTRAGIGALVDAGYRPELIFTLQRVNLGELATYLDLAGELGAGAVKLNVVQPLLRGADLAGRGESLTVAEILELARKLAEEWSDRLTLPVALDVPLAFRPLGALLDGTASGVCDIAHIIGLLPTGDYALCGIGSHVSDLVMGSIAGSELAGLWRSHPLLVRLREGLPERLQGVCAACLMKHACRGSCVAANYQASGDLFAANWFCREAEAAGLFPASRRMDLASAAAWANMPVPEDAKG